MFQLRETDHMMKDCTQSTRIKQKARKILREDQSYVPKMFFELYPFQNIH